MVSGGAADSVSSDLFRESDLQHEILTAEEEYAFFEQRAIFRDEIETLESQLETLNGNRVELEGELKAKLKAKREELQQHDDYFASRNIRLVYSFTQRHCREDLYNERDEIASLLLVPLMNSIRRFDHTTGNKFSSYFCKAMLNEIRKYAEQFRKRRCLSLDSSRTEDGDPFNVLIEGTNDDGRKLYAKDVQYKVDKALERLATETYERDALVLRLRLGYTGGGSLYGKHTLEEIGRKIGVGKERVRQIELRALTWLRENAALTDYLD